MSGGPPFSFGATITPDQVNYDGNYPYGGSSKGEYRRKTVAVDGHIEVIYPAENGERILNGPLLGNEL